MAKFNLTKENSIMAALIVFALIILGAYLFIYAPLIKELKVRYLACKEVENDVIEARNIIESAGRTYAKRVLMPEEDISQAIDEMTRRGKAEGVLTTTNPNKLPRLARQATRKMFKKFPKAR